MAERVIRGNMRDHTFQRRDRVLELVQRAGILAAGGDGFTVFNEGADALGGAQDIDALVAAFAAAEPAGIPVPPLDRIVPPAAA